jgi:tripartite-type tricarboxylate transporter receptor subunit TctC
MRFVIAAVVGASLLSPPIVSLAQDVYPSRPVRILVPGAPGGGFDVLARILAQGLSDKWGRRVFVENQAGGGGNIGASAVIKAEPDGYTVLLGNDTLLINPTLYRVAPFDYKRDFTPVSLLVYAPNILAAHPSSGLNSFTDFVNEATAKPGTLNVASPGNGSPGHLSLEIIKQLASVDIVHVPYRGAGPAVIDLVGGQIQLGMVGIPPVISHLRSGGLVPLAVTATQRMKTLPSVPPLTEVGLSRFSVNQWMGVLAPARMPAELVARLERDTTDVLKDPAVQVKLVELGFEPAPAPASRLAAMMDEEFVAWREAINRLGLKLN